jgi:Restriction endonuclease S subunits
MMSLGEVGTYYNGKAFKPADWSSEGLPIIRIANLNNPEAPFDRFVGEVRPEHLADDGDLLVSWSASLDAYIWSGGPAVVNQHIFKVYERPELVDRGYLWLALRAAMTEIRLQVQGATMQHITKPEFEAIRIPVPELVEQLSIAAQLTAQLTAAVEMSQQARLLEGTCDALVSQVVQATSSRTKNTASTKLSGLVEMRRSPSVISDGEVTVRTVTSGCLTPRGFRHDRLSSGRMSADAAVIGIVTPGEVLVARSNTEELVGRAALYPGGNERVVASDLIFRLVADSDRLLPEYLAMQLASLQLAGYWRDRSSGASSTMKKITKGLLMDLNLPLPVVADQRRIARQLEERLQAIDHMSVAARAQREAAGSVCAALLRRAFKDLAA